MVDVVLLTSPACHLCEDAKEALAELGREFPLAVREVGIGTPEGREIVERFRPPMPPAVVLNGSLFSSGRLPRKKLRKLLERSGRIAEEEVV